MRRIITTLFLVFCSACLISVWAEKKPEMHRIYIFGFAASFTDSIAAQTAIQSLDDAWLDASNDFLIDRSLYSLQLQNHMQSEEGCKNPVCTVFFSTSLRKLQRTWKKIRKRYERAEGLQMRQLPEDRFSFKAEEYREITIGDETPGEIASKSSGKKEKKKKRSK